MDWRFPLICLFLTIALTGSLYNQNPIDRINSYYGANKPDSALSVIASYEPVYQSTGQWDSLVMVLRLKAVVLSSIKPLPEALEAFSRAESMADTYLDSTDREYIMVRLNKGDCLSRMGQYEDALAYYNEVIDLAAMARDTTGLRARALDLKSWVFVMQLKYKDALQTAWLANRELMASPTPDTALLLGNYGTLSQIYHYLTMPDSTLYYGEKWLKYAKLTYPPDHNNIGFAYTSLSGYYYDLREMDQALKYLTLAGDIFYQNFLKFGNSRYLAVSMANKGMMYNELREYRLATEFYVKAIEYLEMEYGPDNPFMIEFYLSLADIKMQTGDFEASGHWLNRVNEIVESDPGAGDEIIRNIQSYLVRYSRLSGDHDTALEIAKDLFNYYDENSTLYNREGISILNEMAQIHLKLGHNEEALLLMKQTLAICDSIFPLSHPFAIRALVDIMRIHLALKHFQEVEKVSKSILERRSEFHEDLNITNCIPLFELLEFAALWAEYLKYNIDLNKMEPFEYFSFIRDFETYYNQHLSIIRSNNTIRDNAIILQKIYQPGIELFTESDPGKALVFADKIKSFLTRILLQSQLVRQEDGALTIRRKLASLQANFIEESSQSILMETGHLLEQLNTYKDSLYRFDRELFNKSFGFPDVTLDEIGSTIGRGEILLEYTFLDSLVYIFGYNARTCFAKPIRRDRVDSLLSAARGTNDRVILNQLYHLLIPIEAKEYSKWFIVPDDKLFYFNFEQLVDEQGDYLIRTKTIRYAYSASIAGYQARLGKQNQNHRNIISLTPGFSDSLKRDYLSEHESGTVDSAWLYYLQQPFLIHLAHSLDDVQVSKSYTGKNATELTFKTAIGDYRILHLGTHGVINDNSPLFSHLIFSKDSIEDGYLHTYEIFAENLNVNLVVLSACETGAGNLSTGEGVVSLAHAFTYAGCPSVLMTLWKIDEKSSARILQRFYHYLIKGESKSHALRKAKLDFLNSVPAEMISPYYWAGLVIMGDDSAVSLTGMNGSGIWVAGGILFLVTILMWYYYKKRKRV